MNSRIIRSREEMEAAMKKIGTLLLVMALLLVPFNNMPVYADDLSGDFYYIENADTTSVTITGYTETAPRNHVVIPQMINGKKVTAIGDEAFQNKSIQSLELPDGLVSIGKRAFLNNLFTMLEVPGSIKSIDEEAFQSNGLTSVTIHDGVEKIGRSSFAKNKLTTLSIPNSVIEIEAGAFQGNLIASLALPNNLVEISDSSFLNNKLTSIVIPASVKIIGSSAFSGNRIAELVIPATVTTLKDSAFYYNALTLVTFLGMPTLDNNTVFGNQYLNGANTDIVDWFTDMELTQVWNNTVTAPMNIYGAWKLNIITFNTNGGSKVDNQSVKFAEKGKKVTLLPTKVGHTFAGWYKEAELSNPWNFDMDIVIRDIMLYAKWTTNTHTVSFQSNGGSGETAQTIAYDSKVTQPANPSKAGHTFAGWYTDSSLTTAWNFGTDLVKGNMTLYAKWTANTYTVSFQSNGGSGETAQTIAYDNKVIQPANPSKAGHVFAGWYTDASLTTAWNFGTGLVKGNMTLYAKWTTNTYTVSFQSNGGSSVTEQELAYDNKVTEPANPSKAGHAFAGWYTDASLTTAWNFGTGLVKGNITLYAKWIANNHTVSFQSNGGSGVTEQVIDYDDKVTQPAPPSQVGHTFVGWYSDASLTTAWDFGTGLVKGNMTLYAKWTANTYTVSFQSNGGSGETAQTIAYDSKVAEPANPSKAGHAFAGWYTDSSLTTAWNFGTGLVKANMTLYAKWTANTYTVSFQSNGGSGETAQTIVYDSKVTEPANPSKAGHAFAGWYADSSFVTEWNFGTIPVKGNMTLYAKWTANTYTVSFQSNGGTGVAEQVVAYDDKVIQPAIPSKAGHTFVEWYTNEDLTKTWMFDTDVITDNMILYAGWDKEIYTVSFETSGGSQITDQRITLEENVVIPTDPKKSGYTFASWFKDEELTLAWNFTTDVVISDIILYAKWSKTNYPPYIPSEPILEPELEVEEEIVEEEEKPKGCSTKFTDISENWARNAITDIASRCIIIGYPDGEFKPNDPIIRAHVAVMFARALELPAKRPSNTFHDVSSDTPNYEAILKVSQAGIFEGSNGYFYPDQQLTRAEVAKILVLAFKLPLGGKSTFQDVPKTHWSSSYIATLESYGLAFGEDGYYKPEEPVTRAEFVAFMYRALRL
ncbi:InlB B-repeat-containing protein [Paenibacillus yanchengensis]|uniref:InlB B-repeat-containing protein n=1 Tax=Paenibacillus yanchengensis TaxID=2035833 RepID=A0ABW4YHU6_9BACL